MNRYSHVITVAGLGMFLSTLDSGVINVALPHLRTIFHSSLSHASWTISLYFLVLSSTILFFGKLSDRFGRVRIFSVGLLLFAVGSLLCGVALTINQMIFYRAVQALGAAAMQATSAALVTTLIDPKRKNAALGLLGLIIGAGPIIGPTFSGLMISFVSWRWIFLINIPICGIGFFFSSKLNDHGKRHTTDMDWMGMVLFAVLICSFAFALTMSGSSSHAGHQPWLFLIVSIITFLLFIKQEKSSPHPMLDLSLFKRTAFVVPLIGTVAFGLATAIVLVVPPIYLHAVADLRSWQIGLVSFSAPLGIVLTARFSGLAIERFGEQSLMIMGLFLMVVAICLILTINQTTNYLWFMPFLLVYGVGGGLFQAPNIAQILKAVSEHHQGTVSAINRMFHNLGNGVGVAVTAFFIGYSNQSQNQMQSLYSSIVHAWVFALSFVGFSIAAFTIEWVFNKRKKVC